MRRRAGFSKGRVNPVFFRTFSIYPLGLPGYDVYTNAQWALTGGGYPYENQLGISTQWCQYSPYENTLYYYIIVQNNSIFPLEYAFVEADF